MFFKFLVKILSGSYQNYEYCFVLQFFNYAGYLVIGPAVIHIIPIKPGRGLNRGPK